VETQGAPPTEGAAPVLLFSLGKPPQVAQDRRLAEDRRWAKAAHGRCGMLIIRAALATALALGLLAAPLAEGQQPGKCGESDSLGSLPLPLST